MQTAGPGRPAYHCPGDVTAEDLGEEGWTSFLPPEGLVGVEGWTSFLPPEGLVGVEGWTSFLPPEGLVGVEGWTSFLPPKGLVGVEVQVGVAVVVVAGWTVGQ